MAKPRRAHCEAWACCGLGSVIGRHSLSKWPSTLRLYWIHRRCCYRPMLSSPTWSGIRAELRCWWHPDEDISRYAQISYGIKSWPSSTHWNSYESRCWVHQPEIDISTFDSQIKIVFKTTGKPSKTMSWITTNNLAPLSIQMMGSTTGFRLRLSWQPVEDNSQNAAQTNHNQSWWTRNHLPLHASWCWDPEWYYEFSLSWQRYNVSRWVSHS